MSDEFDEVERQSCRTLKLLDDKWRDIPDSSAAWTSAIKETLAALGKELGYLVHAGQSPRADDCEWLYDLTWLEMDDDQKVVVDIPVALGSEWKPGDEVLFDFRKLLVSKARHRVMVFWEASDESADALLRRLEESKKTGFAAVARVTVTCSLIMLEMTDRFSSGPVCMSDQGRSCPVARLLKAVCGPAHPEASNCECHMLLSRRRRWFNGRKPQATRPAA